MTKPRLHLIDGTYELFRMHFSKRPRHAAQDRQPVKATMGLVYSLLSLLEDPEEAVTHLAVAFDRPIRSFRNDLFDGYKTDDGIDPELYAQFELAEEATRALGVVVWSMNRWEADDALATGSARFLDQTSQVRIMTPDKDLGQSLVGARVVQIDRMRKKLIDEAALLETKGLRPASVPDYLALVGDAADGIPGLPGFGAKSTQALLAEYGHIEDIPKEAADWSVKVRGAKKLGQTLSERFEDAVLYKKLATLVTDVPLGEGFEDLEYRGAPRAEFLALCDRLRASETLRSRPRWAP